MQHDDTDDRAGERNPLAAFHWERGWETQPSRISALRAVLDPMPKALVVVDRQGNVAFANPAAKACLGLNDPLGSSSALLARILRGEVADGGEIFVAATETEESRWLSVRIWPLLANAAISGSVVLVRDTTDAKRAEEIRARHNEDIANRAKSEALRRTTQQLRAHLNSILGFAQMLAVDRLAPQQRNNVHRILTGGYHVLELINELADLAHAELGSLGTSPEPVRIKEVLKNAVQNLQALASDRKVTLRLDTGACRDSHLRADRRRLRQALLSLLSHVIRGGHSDGVVSIACYETAGNRLRIEICGDGLQQEDYARPPSSLLPMDLPILGDNELGLPLTQRLVKAMGGNMGLESTEAGANRLFVEFFLLDDPLERLAGDGAAMLQLAQSVPEAQQGTILYFEDNPSNLSLMEDILAFRPGIKLLKAITAKSGLEQAERHMPDWILLDLNLPDMPGEMVVRLLRENLGTGRIPITILSGDADPETIRRLVAGGARDYLTKPLDIQKLLDLLDRTLLIRG